MNSIKFNEIDTYKDWGLLLKPRKMLKPTPKTNYVDIPGGNGSLDLSEVVSGEITYKDLTLTFEFTMVDAIDEWDAKYSQIANYLHGRNMKIVQSSDSDYYYYGRCTVDKFSSSKALGSIVIKCTVGPYKLKQNITVNSYEIDIEGKAEGEDITLTDSSNMPFNKFTVRGNSEQEEEPTPDNPSEIKNVEGNIEIKIEGSDTLTDTQTIIFPLAEGQKLMEGSYLADDGVHNVRKQIVLDGSEDWIAIGSTNFRYYTTISDLINESSNTEITVISNKLKGTFYGELYKDNGKDYLISNSGTNGGSKRIFISTNTEETEISSVEELKTWLSQNPITAEYELAEEEIVLYTEEQQEAWNNIKKLTSYKNITHIYSTNEVSPYFDITYQKIERIEINNDRMSVIPKITCEEDTIITFKDNSYSLSAGTHELLNIQFKEGINIVELQGTGTITFEFQEGSL